MMVSGGLKRIQMILFVYYLLSPTISQGRVEPFLDTGNHMTSIHLNEDTAVNQSFLRLIVASNVLEKTTNEELDLQFTKYP